MLVGDSRGRAIAYDRYADGLHTYSLSLLRDHDAAAAVLHATFIVATEHIGRLPDPARLRSWLYAIARNECLRWYSGGRGKATRTARAGVAGDEAMAAL